MSESDNRRKRTNPRTDFRARSHASAHAAVGDRATVIPELPLVPRNTPALIDDPDALAELVAHLRESGSFAYDSEFIGELSYHPKLCLIQVATAQRVALIDSLAPLDLATFWELVADPSLEKIVHAGEQDLEPVFRALGRAPANIFDTQIAAGFTALAYPAGLSKLVRELIGVNLGKGFTFTHWDARPLTPVQLRYAADDVRYLPALRAELGRRLEARGHLAFAREESESLCAPDLYNFDPAADFLRIRGSGNLQPQAAAILRELSVWRDAAARTDDCPPRSYVKDEILIDIARQPTRDVDALKRVKGLPRPVEESQGHAIIDAVKRGLAIPEHERPILFNIEETPAERFGADSLWAVVQACCLGRGIDPAVVASRQEVSRLYKAIARSGEFPADSRIMTGWRGQILGDVLRDLLQGRTRISLDWIAGGLRSTLDKDAAP